ncbi:MULTISPECIES: DUF1501 domain-containing protein [Okeania]|uniref:DUF1501 domain-containing protein n=1 Tax=Okeania hirsuta TaxID=1458930 RepID=A0A3N6N803_9CYAN|nr:MULTISPECIES: DUF1501 domain-containing protein [Okeania]NET76910.1 DUF1501 domain-containing protein [Okeania sp. SIO1F9]RQH10855.1 DUF1501 domain-containing protein [Okeania hirsuta]RQH34468.1 DUF1501 domain-containing protein [Okeania hirsuta]
MKRRNFLQFASLLSASGIISVGSHGWVAKALAQTNNRKRLIVIFLRGGVDGLNVVIPHQEYNYYDARPKIAIPAPGEPEGAIDLDGQFGLHPALTSIMPLWQNRSLAFVHACGLNNDTRSHFDAQYYMETGIPGNKKIPDGWMNRLLANLPKDKPTQAVNLGDTPPRILMGAMPVANLPTGRKSTRSLPIDVPRIYEVFDRLYSNNDELSRVYQEGRQARDLLLADLEQEMEAASAGAPPPQGFAADAKNLAQIMVGDSKTQLGFLALGRWDTHVNQGSSQGTLARRLKPLGEGLVTLVQELGPLYSDTVILVMSEFGRTVNENGNGGTDHGHGNVMWVLGGGLRGGQVYGQWPGLDESELFEKRDLAVTTDFRDVISSVLEQHLEIERSQIARVFSGYSSERRLALL